MVLQRGFVLIGAGAAVATATSTGETFHILDETEQKGKKKFKTTKKLNYSRLRLHCWGGDEHNEAEHRHGTAT